MITAIFLALHCNIMITVMLIYKSLTDVVCISGIAGQYATGIAFISGHSRFKEVVESAYNFCGGVENLLDETALHRSLRVLMPSVSKQQVRQKFICPVAVLLCAYLSNHKQVNQGVYSFYIHFHNTRDFCGN